MDPWTVEPPDGESMQNVGERMYGFLKDNELKKYYGTDRRIAIFSHGNSIRCLIKRVTGIDPKMIWKIGIDNTSITHLAYDDKGWYVKRMNDHAHLKK